MRLFEQVFGPLRLRSSGNIEYLRRMRIPLLERIVPLSMCPHGRNESQGTATAIRDQTRAANKIALLIESPLG